MANYIGFVAGWYFRSEHKQALDAELYNLGCAAATKQIISKKTLDRFRKLPSLFLQSLPDLGNTVLFLHFCPNIEPLSFTSWVINSYMTYTAYI